MGPRLLMRPAKGRPQLQPATTAVPKPVPKPAPKPKGKAVAAVESAKPIQDVLLTQQHSFELVKIGINVAFFPSNVYQTRVYDASIKGSSYEMFMKGSNVPANFNPNNASRDIISFNSVVRGSGHPGVEKLLDWLEFGVAAAVKDKCLAKLQLTLYHKEVTPEHLLEAFTMSFTYSENATGIHVATSTSSRPSKSIELGKAQEGLRDLIVQVMNNTQHIGYRSSQYTIHLPLLTTSRLTNDAAGHKVSMQLVYNQNEPPNSEYRGFCAGGTSLLIPDKSGSLIGNLDTGIHKYGNAEYWRSQC
ncbi:Meiosis-specific HOP1 protein [Rutstroemia sp. NJR-2017a BBW]|nr:Meiosis-specific HOP1 protein [Rutstroemia sp. NJR-2017a BBW]